MRFIRSLLLGDKRTSQPLAILLLVLTAILWSFGGLFIKLVKWNSFAIAGFRSIVASLFILALIRKPKITWSFPKIVGALAYSLTVISFVTATKMTTAANAILLQYSAPIYVAIFSAWFLNEKIKLSDWITIFFVLAGMLLFFIDDINMDNMLGNLIAIFSGIAFAATAIFMRKQKSDSPVESVLLGNIVTAIICLPFMFSSGPDAKGWGILFLLGIFQLGLSYVLYSIAIKQVTALEATLIPVIEPLLNPIWVFLFTGETPGRWALIGGLVVLVSVTANCVISTLKASREEEANTEIIPDVVAPNLPDNQISKKTNI